MEMRDKRTAPAFHNYPRSLNLDADVPDLERREKHNLTALKEANATGLSTGTIGNLSIHYFTRFNCIMEPSGIYLVHLATSDDPGHCTWLLSKCAWLGM